MCTAEGECSPHVLAEQTPQPVFWEKLKKQQNESENILLISKSAKGGKRWGKSTICQKVCIQNLKPI